MKNKSPKFEIKFLRGVVKKNPNYVDALIPLAEAYTCEGMYEEGLEIDKRLSKLCKDDPTVHYNLACSFALVGDTDKAMEALRKAIQLGYADFDHMAKDSDLQNLHMLPEFKALICKG